MVRLSPTCQLGKLDLGGAGEWLNEHRGSMLYEQTAAAYAKELRSEDPIAVKQWVDTIQNEVWQQATRKQLFPP